MELIRLLINAFLGRRKVAESREELHNLDLDKLRLLEEEVTGNLHDYCS